MGVPLIIGGGREREWLDERECVCVCERERERPGGGGGGGILKYIVV